MNLHRSFSTLGCPCVSFDRALEIAVENQIPSIELRTLESSLDLPKLLQKRFGSPQEAHQEKEHFAVEINALNSSCRALGQGIRDWKELLELAPWAEALGAKYLRVFDARPTKEKITSSMLEKANDFFDWWSKQRAENGWRVDVIVETHSILTTSMRIIEFQDALKRPAHILWDSHHTWMFGLEDPIHTWKNIRPWVSHIHIKDSTRTKDSSKPTYTLPGLGEFPFSDLFAELKRSGFSGPVSLEWEKHWHPDLPPLNDSIKACKILGW
ncbi:sugar phosphate isomerase/epimerase family protein [Puniceicoccus vermicola]|uniref:Sugar phosphate isomerase/epimerase n=1 Tax=Puniceicoccus vermicola TaxID=388746 RepID=A0A7X1E2S7_9BACT|nr:TIM barrel protein [Puniceicoccus vermicola]MBC2600244.1 sugar phosphate isomerase/epimerase [Puniceicoccus vermicola]